MKTKAEIVGEITHALNLKTGGSKPCVLCGKVSWIVADKFSRLGASTSPQKSSSGEGFPNAVLVCTNCGNTHLINLLALGFTNAQLDEFGQEEDHEQSESK